MDGTLLDSEWIYHAVIKKMCKRYSREYTDELEKMLYGATDEMIWKTVVNELKLPISADEFGKQMTELINNKLPSAPILPGVERLLLHLNDYKIPCAIATNSTEQAVRIHAKARPKFFRLFKHVVDVSDKEVLRGKPQPDIFLVAASRFKEKPRPHKCLVFEDSPTGVAAAVAAGMQVVMIADKRVNRELTRHATLVIPSILKFKPELFQLPPFRHKKQ